jgi:hypothetical protein
MSVPSDCLIVGADHNRRPRTPQSSHQLSLPGSQPTLGRLRKLACPAIHEDCQRALNFIMDARVKPAHDKREAPITRMV